MLLIIWCRYHTNCSQEKLLSRESQEKVDKVIEFYCNDENSRQIPRKKRFCEYSSKITCKSKRFSQI